MFSGHYEDAEPFWRVKYGVLSIPNSVDRTGRAVRKWVTSKLTPRVPRPVTVPPWLCVY